MPPAKKTRHPLADANGNVVTLNPDGTLGIYAPAGLVLTDIDFSKLKPTPVDHPNKSAANKAKKHAEAKENAVNVESIDPTEDPKPKAAKPKPTKRKSDAVETRDANEIIDDDDERLEFIEWNCNQIRTRIRALINSGEMKVGEFQKASGASAASYSRFMGQNGPYAGSGCDIYHAAHVFFKKRELAGIKPPKKQKVAKAQEEKHDVSGIHLDGEEDEVPVFDTCDEVRKKINAYLREPGTTQAGFLRAIGGKSASQLQTFLGKKGPAAGNTSGVFYSAYVFFEKLRIRDKKPKSKFRKEMEQEWAFNPSTNKPGFDTKYDHSRGFWAHKSEAVTEDKYGKVHFDKR